MDKQISEIGTLSSSDGHPLLHMWRVTVPCGMRTLRRHNHLSFEITLVASGEGQYTVGDRLYPMKAGDIFVFASNEQHCITDVSAGEFVIVNLHFEPRLLWGSFADRLTEENLGFCFSHGKDFENRICAEEGKSLRTLFSLLETEFLQAKEEYALSVRSYLNLMLVCLIREYGYASGGAGLSRSRLHAIRRVLEYVDVHLSEELTLACLADRAGMSPNYLSALFHKISGITLWDYITTKRIDKATRLLMDERELNILDIASLCGFNNTAAFNKAFKKITGITPSEYRMGECVLY